MGNLIYYQKFPEINNFAIHRKTTVSEKVLFHHLLTRMNGSFGLLKDIESSVS